MSAFDRSCVPVVRREIENALDHLSAARRTLAAHGPELAEMLDRSIRHVATWTQPDGILDHCEREPIPIREAAE